MSDEKVEVMVLIDCIGLKKIAIKKEMRRRLPRRWKQVARINKDRFMFWAEADLTRKEFETLLKKAESDDEEVMKEGLLWLKENKERINLSLENGECDKGLGLIPDKKLLNLSEFQRRGVSYLS